MPDLDLVIRREVGGGGGGACENPEPKIRRRGPVWKKSFFGSLGISLV